MLFKGKLVATVEIYFKNSFFFCREALGNVVKSGKELSFDGFISFLKEVRFLLNNYMLVVFVVTNGAGTGDDDDNGDGGDDDYGDDNDGDGGEDDDGSDGDDGGDDDDSDGGDGGDDDIYDDNYDGGDDDDIYDDNYGGDDDDDYVTDEVVENSDHQLIPI